MKQQKAGLAQPSPEHDEVVGIRVDRISPSPFQPREFFDEEELKALAASIKEKGLIQPIVVRLLDQKGNYELVVGERRWRACQLLGMDIIKAIVKDYTPEQAREVALIENLQREDLTVLEEARSLKALAEQYQDSLQAVADKIGKSLGYVRDRVFVLALPAQIQVMLETGKINMSQVKVVAELDGEDTQLKAAKLAQRLNLTANQLKGRLQRESKKSGIRERSLVPSPQRLAGILVRTYEMLEGVDMTSLRGKKKETLRSQLSLLHKAIEAKLQALDKTA